jgi:hypothetical protein
MVVVVVCEGVAVGLAVVVVVVCDCGAAVLSVVVVVCDCWMAAGLCVVVVVVCSWATADTEITRLNNAIAATAQIFLESIRVSLIWRPGLTQSQRPQFAEHLFRCPTRVPVMLI